MRSNSARLTPVLSGLIAIVIAAFLCQAAFGYRIDYRGRSVVLSGDTRFSPRLIEKAAIS